MPRNYSNFLEKWETIFEESERITVFSMIEDKMSRFHEKNAISQRRGKIFPMKEERDFMKYANFYKNEDL